MTSSKVYILQQIGIDSSGDIFHESVVYSDVNKAVEHYLDTLVNIKENDETWIGDYIRQGKYTTFDVCMSDGSTVETIWTQEAGSDSCYELFIEEQEVLE